MKFQRWGFVIFAIAVMVGLVIVESPKKCLAAQNSGSKDQSVNFQWAFGAIKKAEDDSRFIPVTKDTNLKSGDRIKFFLKVSDNCHIYLIYHSAQGELNMLFPYRLKQSGSEITVNGLHYIPEGENWFRLDENQGKEKFYLLASAKPLIKLESLVNAYEGADSAGRPDLASKILAEIRRLRKQYIKLKAHAERPVNIIGNMRSNDDARKNGSIDIAAYAIEISAEEFFSRTFTIDHQ